MYGYESYLPCITLCKTCLTETVKVTALHAVITNRYRKEVWLLKKK